MQLRESTFLKKTASFFRFNLPTVTRNSADIQFLCFGKVYIFNFHIRTVNLDIIKVVFTHQLMHSELS